MKKWVTARKDLQVGNLVIPKGTLGFIKDKAHVKGEEGAVQFPMTVAHFKKRELEPVDVSGLSIDTLLDAIGSFELHHCKRDGEFQFNIKVYGYDIPSIIRDNFDDSQIYGEVFDILEWQLKQFVDKKYDDASLQADFPWIKSFRQEGRSGGWLILRHADNLSSENLRDRWEELNYDLAEDKDNEELQEELNQVENTIIDLALDLQVISHKIRDAVQGTKGFINTEEAWFSLLETLQPKETEVTYACPSCRFTHKLDIEGKLPSVDLVYYQLQNVLNRLSEQSDTEYLKFKPVLISELEDLVTELRPIAKEEV